MSRVYRNSLLDQVDPSRLPLSGTEPLLDVDKWSTPKATKSLPLSGYEPLLVMDKWSTPKAIGDGNCYSFALDDYVNAPYPIAKAQPGDRAGLSRTASDLSTCDIAKRVLADNPGRIYQVKAETPCRKGYYKIFLFNDPDKQGGDFHFWRQVKDVLYRLKPGETISEVTRQFQISRKQAIPMGSRHVLLQNVNVFAHKLGYATPALLRDSCKRIIKDPRKACRFVGPRQYSLDCGSFCAKAGEVRTRNDKVYRNATRRWTL